MDRNGATSHTVPLPLLTVVFPKFKQFIPSFAQYSILNHVITFADVDDSLLLKLIQFVKQGFVNVNAYEGIQLKELLYYWGLSPDVSLDDYVEKFTPDDVVEVQFDDDAGRSIQEEASRTPSPSPEPSPDFSPERALIRYDPSALPIDSSSKVEFAEFELPSSKWDSPRAKDRIQNPYFGLVDYGSSSSDNESELDVHSKRVGVKDESTVSKSKKSSVHRVLRDHDIVVCMDENCPLSFPSKPKMLAHMCLSHGYRAKLTEMLPEYFTLENKLINKKMEDGKTYQTVTI